MKQVFVDTSAWDAIADAGDANHETALAYKDEIAENCQLVVTNYIFDELHTFDHHFAQMGFVKQP